MPELLLELLSEEIPARMQKRASEDFRQLMIAALKARSLDFERTRSFVTPRRLTIVVEGLPERQPDVVEEKKGPKIGAPEQAIAGFMRANGLLDISEAEVQEAPKGSFYVAVRKIEGRTASEALPDAIIEALSKFSWPKSMRWGEGTTRWVRPLHSICAVFDGEALEGSFDLGGGLSVAFGNQTSGHRFMAPEAFKVSSFADYREKLRTARVILDAEERREIIANGARSLAGEAGLSLKEDPGLLAEVAGLVEWPEPFLGTIDEAFMDLPHEVLATSLKVHQKYFSTTANASSAGDRFVFVSNLAKDRIKDGGSRIIAGNERVLSARLADARFFWDHDRKIKLEARVKSLRGIVFHAKLGTLGDKVERMESLTGELASYIPGCDKDAAWRAARLSKADLTSGMVGEFPELQGIMGRYYALHDGEAVGVGEAIADHYAPQGPSDDCPSAPLSVALALADKIDTLTGFWAIDEKPTGSKDPFALRRAALGVIRLIVENKLRLPLNKVIHSSLDAHASAGPLPAFDEVTSELIAFFAERLKVALKDRGVRHDLINAVFALGDEDDLLRLLDRVEALSAFLKTEDGANLLVAHGRAANIVKIESKKDQVRFDEPVDASLLAEESEAELFEALESAREAAEAAISKENFGGAMAAMARLRKPVDNFFDQVMVNAENRALRSNRLRLLSAIDKTLLKVADFSRIEG